MKKYQNKKTGKIVMVNSELKGDWELVKEQSPIIEKAEEPEEEKKPVKKAKKK